MNTLLGVALACVASMLFNGAVVLQARETRAVPREQGLHLSLLGSLLRRRRWLVGIALQVFGIGLQTGALLLAPLTAVQPAEAAGLAFLLYLGARHLGERVGRTEIIAVASIAVGIVGLTIAAPKRHVTNVDAPDVADVWLPLAALALAAVAPYMLRGWRGAGSLLTVVGAGFAFALSAFCAKLLADALTERAWGALVIVAVIAGAGGAIGTLSEQSALQQRQATQVAPLIFVIELLVPVGLAVTVVGESWSNSPVLIGICLTLVTFGTIVLGRTPTIGQLIVRSSEHEAPTQARDTGASPPA
jgi:drug/metabolite transporter (DMT)-like permease